MNNEEIEFALSVDNIKNIPTDKYEPDFTFVVNGKIYSTPRFVADILSPKIRKLHYVDESINEFRINTDDESIEDYFQDFLKLSNFETSKIDKTRKKSYSFYFKELGNIEGYMQLQSEMTNSITTENAISQLLAISELFQSKSEIETFFKTDKLSELISFISIHFYELKREEIKLMSRELFEAVISSEKLKLNDEDDLFGIVLEMYEKDHLSSGLFSNIIFCNLSDESIDKFISLFDYEDMNNEIWESICSRLSSSKKKDVEDEERYVKKREIKEFECEPGHEFEGIMNNLSTSSGGNIHDNGTVEITTNSIHENNGKFHPKNLADYNKASFYYSDNCEDVFICFDFKDKQIQLTSYSIKSSGISSGSGHLRNWVIEVSKDGNEWKEVDHHTNDSTLNEPNIIGTFKVSEKQTDFYHFVRLRQIGYSWRGDYFIYFPQIEFFGKLERISK